MKTKGREKQREETNLVQAEMEKKAAAEGKKKVKTEFEEEKEAKGMEVLCYAEWF